MPVKKRCLAKSVGILVVKTVLKFFVAFFLLVSALTVFGYFDLFRFFALIFRSNVLTSFFKQVESVSYCFGHVAFVSKTLANFFFSFLNLS